MAGIISGQKLSINAPLFIVCLSLLIRLFGISSNNLLVEEAYYWNYAQHFDIGYLDHPPMVAALIKFSTFLLGANEWGVRSLAIGCSLLTGFFIFKWTNALSRGAGQYAVMLFAVLPFYFLQSLVMTPDQPLMVCWAAALYYLYNALVLDKRRCFLIAGIWLGLGMLSKYTIVLLGPSVILYMLIVPKARVWFFRKEPFLCVLITLLLFTPVLYWNATHEWLSFVFQGKRRMDATLVFSLHHFLGLLVFFLMPMGMVGLWQLFRKNANSVADVERNTQRFLQVFTLLPLSVFGAFSLTHEVKFNWIGPGLLALIHWLALLIQKVAKTNAFKISSGWWITIVGLLCSYSVILWVMGFGKPVFVQKVLFQKFISWESLTREFHTLAKQVEDQTHATPTFVPLDIYNISSELLFYQAKMLSHNEIQKTYPVVGAHIFGGESLMYRYWTHKNDMTSPWVILIAPELAFFDRLSLEKYVTVQSKPRAVWARSQGRYAPMKRYYYQIAQLK